MTRSHAQAALGRERVQGFGGYIEDVREGLEKLLREQLGCGVAIKIPSLRKFEAHRFDRAHPSAQGGTQKRRSLHRDLFENPIYERLARLFDTLIHFRHESSRSKERGEGVRAILNEIEIGFQSSHNAVVRGAALLEERGIEELLRRGVYGGGVERALRRKIMVEETLGDAGGLRHFVDRDVFVRAVSKVGEPERYELRAPLVHFKAEARRNHRQRFSRRSGPRSTHS